MEGRAVWIRIVKAIEELLSEERPGDAEVHFRIADFGLRTRRWMSAYGYKRTFTHTVIYDRFTPESRHCWRQ